jgi:hypothetical protein
MHKVPRSLLRESGHWWTLGVTADCGQGLAYDTEGLGRSRGVPRGGNGVPSGRTTGGSGGKIPVQMAAREVR